MESISGKKFDTLMESFGKGMLAILEAGSGYNDNAGILAQDLLGDEKNFGVFNGLLARTRKIENDVNWIFAIKKMLGDKLSPVIDNFSDDIQKEIDGIDDEISSACVSEDNEKVDGSTKSEINEKIKNMDSIINKANNGFKSLNKSDIYVNPIKRHDVNDVNTFGELKQVLNEINNEFKTVKSEYAEARKKSIGHFNTKVSEKSVDIPYKYKNDTELLLKRMMKVDSFKNAVEALGKHKGEYSKDKQLAENPDTAADMYKLLDQIEKPWFGGERTINTLDFAAATILFYSIAAQKGHLQIGYSSIKGSDAMSEMSPRENIMLAMYSLLGFNSLKRRKWIVSRVRGIDWENFEALFKFELIANSIKSAGSTNIDSHYFPSDVTRKRPFLKKTEDDSDENLSKYKYWAKLNGRAYVLNEKDEKYVNGVGDLIGDKTKLDEEGYISHATDTENDSSQEIPEENKDGKKNSIGTLEICYNIPELVGPELIETSTKIYDEAVELATLILDLNGNSDEEIAREIVEDRGCTALCIFYAYMKRSGGLNNFKVGLVQKTSIDVYNIVKRINSEEGESGIAMVSIDKYNGGKYDKSGKQSENPNDI